uniref:NADH:ubiquinone reductase (H(+)-translocating) n=1 Tax=Lissoclinum patella TaxID=13110 RepID=A0A059VIP6_9ASCI|nr:NADH dehydrogenase subunit 5 [Lissoclinum patella]
MFMYYDKNIFFFDFFLLDFLSLGMLFMLTLIGMVIFKYNKMYFPHEISKKKFNVFLLLFILVMFMFTISINFILMYVFWELVGVMSFILINWWKERKKSLAASFSTILYNRCGDFFFFIVMGMLSGSGFFFYFEDGFFFGIIMISIMTKSALFFFHPWLPLAMEGPTPVSSLLHSSTMVVAGVFMYLRLTNMMDLFFNNLICIISSMTFLWGGFSSFNQKDMKKIIAYSTMSQMGFIVMTCSMVSIKISFFILICHGFFKSMLFMCSGVFIHSSLNIQSKKFTHMSKLSNPMTHYIYLFSVLSLMGLPFFTGFIYKHIVLDNLLSSVMNSVCLVSFYMGSMFTVTYSSSLLDGGIFNTLKINFITQTEKMNSFFFYIFFLFLFGFFGGFFFF